MTGTCISLFLAAFANPLNCSAARNKDQMPMLEALGWLIRCFWQTLADSFRRIWHEYKM